MSYSAFKVYVKEVCLENAADLFLKEYFGESRITYGEFWEKIQSTDFSGSSLDKGETVLLPLVNNIQSVVNFFSLLIKNIKPVLIKEKPSKQDIENIISLSHAKKIVNVDTTVSRLTNKYEKLSSQRHSNSINNEVAYLVFSSGTTGKPKGIQITYKNIIYTTKVMVDAYALSKKDIHLCMLPIYHASGLYRNILMAFDAGAKSVLLNNFDVKKFWQIIDEENISFTQINPTIISSLLKFKTEPFQLPPKLRFIGSASSPHPIKLVKSFEDQFGCRLLVGYGMTEATCGITLNNDIPRKNYSIGKPLNGLKVSVVNEKGLIEDFNKEGELIVSGPTIMAGYSNPDKLDSIMVNEEELKTGDMGYIDKEGYIYITGRKDNLVKRGGYRFNTVEIENAIYKLDYIKECSVISVPHPLLGNDIIAFVVLDTEFTHKKSKDLIRDIKTYLDKIKIPSEFILIDKLPVNNLLKVDKKKLFEKFNQLKESRIR